MRLLALLLLAATQLCLAQSPSNSEPESAFKDRILANLRRPFPTDADLSHRIAEHRKDFEQLVAMAKTDKELLRIAADFTWTTSSVAWPRPASELGFTRQRWDEYRRLFQTLGLEAGVLRPWDHRDAVYLLVQSKGLVTGGSTKGYAYSETTLEPQCESLDKPEAVVHTEICFKPLGGNWYLYLQQD
jgi:hypothetical protein